VSAWFFLIPPMTAVTAWLLVGEVMPPAGWLGMAIAAAGVALVTRQ
jgi:drug/metabolite transporter (DMT)-like permease